MLSPRGQEFFRDPLRRWYIPDFTERQPDIAIDRGCYGEQFDYDAHTGELVLSEVATAPTAELAPRDARGDRETTR